MFVRWDSVTVIGSARGSPMVFVESFLRSCLAVESHILDLRRVNQEHQSSPNGIVNIFPPDSIAGSIVAVPDLSGIDRGAVSFPLKICRSEAV